MSPAGISKASRAIPRKLTWGTSRLSQDPVRNGAMAEIRFRLDPEIVVSRRHTRDYHAESARLPSDQEPILIVAVVVTDFASKVVSLSRVLVNKCVVQVDPVVISHLLLFLSQDRKCGPLVQKHPSQMMLRLVAFGLNV